MATDVQLLQTLLDRVALGQVELDPEFRELLKIEVEVDTSAPGGIACDQCNSTLHEVLESRKDLGAVIRRRKCFNGHTFYTRETTVDEEVYREWNRKEVARRRRKKAAESSRNGLFEGRDDSGMG